MAKKAEEPENPLAKANQSALVSQPAPDYIPQERDGFDTVDPADVLFNRLALMQDKTKRVEESQGAINTGDIVRVATNEIIWRRGMRPIRFVIAAYFKEYVEFGDRNVMTDPVVKNRSVDPKSQLAEICRKRTKVKSADGKMVNQVNDVHNFVILLDGRPNEPLLLGCLKGSAKAGGTLLALANGRGKVPIYAGMYQLSTFIDRNRKGDTFNNYRFVNDPETPWASKEMMDAAKKTQEFFKELQRQNKVQGIADEDVPDDEGGHAAPTPSDPNKKSDY
jgi:hypothetical protein